MDPIMGVRIFLRTQVIPGCFSFIGVGNPEMEAYGSTTPNSSHEGALSLGTAIHVNTAFNALKATK